MTGIRFAKVAVLYATGDEYAPWLQEAMEHSGLLVDVIDEKGLENLLPYHCLILAGNGLLPPERLKQITEWADRVGGAIVCTAGTWGLERELGIEPRPDLPRYSRMTMVAVDPSSRIWNDGAKAVQFIGGIRCVPREADVLARTPQGEPLLTRRGRAYYFGPHIGQTMSLLMMGRAVANDMIGPGDGTAVTENGKLQAEDGTNLRFAEDRERPEGCTVPIFLQPHVDFLRDIWMRMIMEAIEAARATPLLVWHLPNNANAAIAFSIDADTLTAEHVRIIAGGLTKFGLPAAWMVPPPGYGQDMYRAFRKWDHETALLFATDGESMSEDQMKIQNLTIARAAGLPGVSSVRTNDGHWHGLTRFYEIAELAGAKLSLSKGGRQPGTSGFLFGTCHMFFPVRRSGKPFSIAELPYAAFRPGVVTPDSAIPALIDRVTQVHGCLHVAQTASGVSEGNFEVSLQQMLMAARNARLLSITPEQLYQYEKARRQLRVKAGEESLHVVSDFSVRGLTIMIGGSGITSEVGGRRSEPIPVKRYGMLFTSVVTDLDPKTQTEVNFRHSELAA